MIYIKQRRAVRASFRNNKSNFKVEWNAIKLVKVKQNTRIKKT